MRRISTALILALTPSMATAQAPAEPPPTPIVLRPAAEPLPALKYRLEPDRSRLVPGNAAVFYHRAILMMLQKQASLDAERRAKEPPGARPSPPDERLWKWVACPIAEVPVDQARALVEVFGNALKEIELGAIRSECDWEFDRRDEGISLLLPEIQESRGLARLVALKARLAILGGRTDEAMHWVEVGLTLGRHVSRGPILIQALVGIAIDNLMARCLEELIQAPGTPSLYWALADRPRPFVDLRGPLNGERHFLEKELPGLLELDKGPWSLHQGRKFADDLQRKLFMFESGRVEEGPAQRLGIAAMTAKVYPEARRALIAGGMPEAEVEAMPVVQVASLYSFREYRARLDEAYKWLNVPYWQATGNVDAPIVTSIDKQANPLLWMFWSLMPALNATRLSELRLERQFDVLQCVEAIRLHAQSHGGKLPASLDEMAGAPAPIDPATGKPFAYKLDGDSATLTASLAHGFPNHPSYAIRYSLKPAK